VAANAAGEGDVSNARRLLGDFLVYGSGRFAIQLFSFVTLPILTRVFTPADYGVIESFATLALLLAVTGMAGLDSASQRSYFDYEAGDPRRRTVLSSAFWTLLVWSGLLTGALMLAAGPLTRTLAPGRSAHLLILALAAVPLGLALQFFLEILRLEHKPWRYSILSLTAAASSTALILILAAGLHLGLTGNYLGALLGLLPALALGLATTRRALSTTLDWEELRRMLRYGIPLVPVAAAAWVMQLADRFFLLRFATLREVGLYGTGVRLASVLLLFVTAFGVAWGPFMLDLHARDAEAERRVRALTLTYAVIGLAFVAVTVSLFAREFFRTVTPPRFESAYKVVGITTFAFICTGISSITITGISLSRQTGYFARYALYAAALNVALNFALIPPFHMVGAAIATALTSLALCVLQYRRAQLLDRAEFDVRRVGAALATATGIVAVGTFAAPRAFAPALAEKMCLLVAYPVALRLIGVLRPGDASLIRSALRRSGAVSP
jgi:O-antigen/teichoic acid export membrane protein